MAGNTKSSVIELPLKITLTTEGVEWFIKHNRKLSRLRMADNSSEYGIFLNNFTASSLQKMINIEYISTVEIARPEFASKRKEIMDLCKLIVYRILYKKFDVETFRIFLNSPLIKKWNRINPSRIIDENSNFNESFLGNMMAESGDEISQVSLDIQEPLLETIHKSDSLAEEERKISIYLVDHYLINLRHIIWCVLAKSRGFNEYHLVVTDIRKLLAAYLEKAKIAEYLALMVMELATYAESAHFQKLAGELYPDHQAGAAGLILSPKVREAVLRRIDQKKDYLYLTWKISTKGASIGTDNRLRIILFNREKEYHQLKQEIEDRSTLDLKEKSLSDYYEELPEEKINTELGLYYLSYLNEACEQHNIRFDAYVNQLGQSEQNLITLVLQF